MQDFSFSSNHNYIFFIKFKMNIMRFNIFKTIVIIVVFLSVPLSSISQNKLNVIVIFAHPDEGEIYAGGITALYTQLGHEVKFMSLTNGDAGHYSMTPEDLAKRRYKEAMNAKEILGLSDYEVLDYHDGILENTEEIRKKVYCFYLLPGCGWPQRQHEYWLDSKGSIITVRSEDNACFYIHA
jgi:hypothetical protein